MPPDTESGGGSLEVRRRDDDLFLFDPARLPEPMAHHFDPAWWEARDRVTATARGRGTVHMVQSDQGSWVLRRYRRGGLVRHLVKDRYLWIGAARSRPFRELGWLARLHAQGLPVPPPVAARVRRRGTWYRGALLTVRVPGIPLGDALREGRPEPRVWHRVGQVVRGLHDAGVSHPDLNVENLLVHGEEVFVLDFDRARGGPWRIGRGRNLARLRRSAWRMAGDAWDRDPRWAACRAALQEGYREGWRAGAHPAH